MFNHADQQFILWNIETSLSIYVDKKEFHQVKRACNDLQKDICLVADYKPDICDEIYSCKSDKVIIAGTYEKNEIIRKIALENGFDPERLLKGRERYCIFSAEIPETGKEILVIIGSDMRGCIYGIYKISSLIGVSPFYWWADVIPVKQRELKIENLPIITESPSVEYRGIFINDERNFQLWSKKFEDKAKNITGSPNLFVYEKVFELLLRLNGNTIWPAMHPYSTAFNKVTDKDGIPINAKAADDYGIIVGTSHCENMLRNNVGEWEDWAEQYKKNHKGTGKVKYDYSVSPEAVNRYWKERIDTNKGFENIFTLGMRGIHDGSMSLSKIRKPTLEDKIRITNEIIKTQRNMLEEVYGKDNLPPQIFVPYKEAADLYNGDPKNGVNGIDLPDDVTLMWSDDNHGYIRQFPNEQEKNRKGGNGVYYHVSYWGYPCSYLWINSTPLGMIHREFTTAYKNGIRKIFIINVGDIKPAEISLAFQMHLLFNMDYKADCAESFLKEFGKSTFALDHELSEEFAFIVQEYYRLAITLRPEFAGKFSKRDFDGKSIYSVVHNFDEASQMIERFDRLTERSEKLKSSISDSLKDAYYELIHYMIISASSQLKHHLYWQKYELSLLQGRKGSCEIYRSMSEKAYDDMMEYVRYFNEELQKGKWNEIMNPYPKEYKAAFNVPIYHVPQIAPKRKFRKAYKIFSSKGISISAQDEIIPGEIKEICLDNLMTSGKFIDVFSKSGKEENYHLSHEDYILVSGYTGTVKTEERLWVSADWEKLPTGTSETFIEFTCSGKTVSRKIVLSKYDESYPVGTHVESDGKIIIDASKFLGNGENVKILSYPGRSREAAMLREDSSPLEYNVYFHSVGEFLLTLCRIPTLNEGYYSDGTKKEISVCVRFDNDGAVILKGCGECYEKVNGWLKPRIQWRDNVYRHIEYLTCKIRVKEKGMHSITISSANSDFVLDKIIIHTKGERNSYLYPAHGCNKF